MRGLAILAAVAALAAPLAAVAAQPGEAAFRDLYKALVETNTTQSAGSCTLAAERMAARLKAAGFPDADLTLFSLPEFPKDGGLVAVYPGRDPKAGAILLLAHLDVVEARREDWTRDPFTLFEEGGYFYARGAADDKAQAAIFTDLFIRLRQEGYRPRHTLKLALTCGEEGGRFNGASWLAQNRRDLIDAKFALNEWAGVNLDASGKPVFHAIMADQKTVGTYRLEATNPGGHSSRPLPDNAIYHVTHAVDRIAAYEFPVQLNDVTRAYFSAMSKILGGERGAAMAAIVADPNDAAAKAVLARDPNDHAMMGTTCVATMFEAGHAANALPQRATATINCRIVPGVTRAEVRDTLVGLIDDPQVSVSEARGREGVAGPPLTPQIMDPIRKVSGELWPGVPVVPTMEAAATDGKALIAAGIPTYGVMGLALEPDLGHMHGLNERIGVKSVLDAREFTYRLVKIYADQKD
ncbi:MAG: M20/M25/M40 family metallo-hydrolase [Phenylobacterium sp.]|uniref:M20/M25/M40 family metallo-hydrolase n=1 Tax=Phenylobacterium sp. TaxID=1871053 RepID=UPI0025F522C4|nr:M20/M25/M40 family metallo-hydrolase [Phenylobacterium sp.]MBI1200722.1 M20/M25/M40 family metallo-hydrolase [Phenylobacterium sp.]